VSVATTVPHASRCAKELGVGACRCHTFSDADTTEAVDCTSVARRISFTAHLNCIHEHITHESISLHNVLEAGFGVG
jgi:hypothetical protein